MITDDEDMDVVDELLAEVKAAREDEAAYERRVARIYDLFLQVRREHPELGPADIEEMIGRWRDRATISRKTAPAPGRPRKGGPRKKTYDTPNSPHAPSAGE